MQDATDHPLFGGSDLEPDPTFNVVIAYEDLESGKHAKRTYDFLARNMGRDCVFANQMWKFDVLSIPKLREIAAKDALMAEVIMVSCRGDRELSAELKTWIELWLNEKGNAIALVALLGHPETDVSKTRAIRDYLADVARRGGMEFFAEQDQWPTRQIPEPVPAGRETKLEDRALSGLAGAVQRDLRAPHWGINE